MTEKTNKVNPANVMKNLHQTKNENVDGIKSQSPITGNWVELDGDQYYRIANSNLMPEFFMSLATASDHWMFISSCGALTAGRCDADNALFPYYSADKISDCRAATGPRSILRISLDDQLIVWEPFSSDVTPDDNIVRSLYKNSAGNKLCFEEIHGDLGLAFRYRWTFSHNSGFVRTTRIFNLASEARQIDLIDGIQNIMPASVDQNFQARFSNLVDAYKKNELIETNGVGIYYLSSIPTDRAEPSEGLRATVVWPTRIPDQVLLSSSQLKRFKDGLDLVTEHDIRARRGAWFGRYQLDLAPNETADWDIVANINLDQTDIVELLEKIKLPEIRLTLKAEIDDGENRLLSLIAESDGLQFSQIRQRNQRHLSNVMFNIMRGGIPVFGYSVDTHDFIEHLTGVNRNVLQRHRSFLNGLADTLPREQFFELISELNDDDLLRIAHEYLPFAFSRRHGDPTRPWNEFSIQSHIGDSERSFAYQGNWRDIFQNWEALAISFPAYINGMICRFVNASTADGYNPYRLKKEGFEWEEPDPNDPWANIGYWGDHQIIYLAKLLELSRSHYPEKLDHLLDDPIFVYANVPYRIKASKEIFEDPCDTIVFDATLAKSIERNCATLGNDAKLLLTSDSKIQKATLAEKLLVPALVKMSNFVPDGGVWLNTQRPEWNDANNALVGRGLSVVTTCYLRRYLAFLNDWFTTTSVKSFNVSTEIVKLLEKIQLAISPYVVGEQVQISPSQRYQVVVDLSEAGSAYREGLYNQGLSAGVESVSTQFCCDFFQQSIRLLDATILSNRRSDGLYHSYNLMSRDVDGEIQIERLYEMLEGQVAVLSAGILSLEQVVEVLESLRASSMYRQDQQSYMLYPNRRLPRFMEKNAIPSGLVNLSPLLKKLIERGDESIVRLDPFGNCRFNGNFRNSTDIRQAIGALEQLGIYDDVISGAADQIASIFENMFCHHQFTGRSGTFFAYEGLGSIYWHMVSKLGLAVMENYVAAKKIGAADDVLERLASHLREIRWGIGAEKEPFQYGAFPFDPYSHTPEHAGAQQPGMTGQVKEDILFRFAEIGVRVDDGKISFEPSLLEFDEWSSNGDDPNRPDHTVQGSAGRTFSFSLCNVPIVYIASDQIGLRVQYSEGTVQKSNTLELSVEQSRAVFDRTGEIDKIEVEFDPASLT